MKRHPEGKKAWSKAAEMTTEQYIDQVYREPFSLLHNNCFHQALKLVRKARSLGIQANMVICISKAPKRLWRFIPIVSPHAYAIIDGVKVDVALSPEQEQRYWKNSERRIYLPIKILPELKSKEKLNEKADNTSASSMPADTCFLC